MCDIFPAGSAELPFLAKIPSIAVVAGVAEHVKRFLQTVPLFSINGAPVLYRYLEKTLVVQEFLTCRKQFLYFDLPCFHFHLRMIQMLQTLGGFRALPP